VPWCPARLREEHVAVHGLRRNCGHLSRRKLQEGVVLCGARLLVARHAHLGHPPELREEACAGARVQPQPRPAALCRHLGLQSSRRAHPSARPRRSRGAGGRRRARGWSAPPDRSCWARPRRARGSGPPGERAWPAPWLETRDSRPPCPFLACGRSGLAACTPAFPAEPVVVEGKTGRRRRHVPGGHRRVPTDYLVIFTHTSRSRAWKPTAPGSCASPDLCCTKPDPACTLATMPACCATVCC